jgi:hypothetical protein
MLAGFFADPVYLQAENDSIELVDKDGFWRCYKQTAPETYFHSERIEFICQLWMLLSSLLAFFSSCVSSFFYWARVIQNFQVSEVANSISQ